MPKTPKQSKEGPHERKLIGELLDELSKRGIACVVGIAYPDTTVKPVPIRVEFCLTGPPKDILLLTADLATHASIRAMERGMTPKEIEALVVDDLPEEDEDDDE